MSVKEKQNNKEILSLQYSARHAYNFAEVLGWLSWLLTLALIIIGWFDNGTHPELVAYITAIITIINAAIDYCRTRRIKLAAAIRSFIDYTLFGFEHNSIYNGFTVSKINEYSEFVAKFWKKTHEKQTTHSGSEEYKGVMNWYALKDGMTKEEEIASAQKENCSYDASISKSSYVFTCIMLAVGLICIITIDNKLLLICAFAPAILKIIKMFVAYNEYKKINIEEQILVSKLNDCKSKYDLNILFELQKCIDERRRLDYISLSFLYKLKSTRLHNRISKEQQSD